MRISAPLLAFALCVAPVAAHADSGVGEAPRYGHAQELEDGIALDGHDILDGVRALPMRRLGPDAIRFSRAPALGGDGFVMTLRPRRHAAIAEIVWVFGHNGLGWRRTRQQTVTLTRDEYDEIAAMIDRLLLEGAAEDARSLSPGSEEAIVVCSDGPGYLVERNRSGAITWRGHSCGDDTTAAIHDILTSFLFDRLGSRR